eukprot:scaffold360113_cov96-Cyclotella_meneghiniana.AAC.2
MERFLRVKTTPQERKLLRMALHHMRVVTLADIADPTGTYIPGDRLTGSWRANTAWEWPKQPQPPKKAFATLRRLLRNTICQYDSPYQPIDSDLAITEPMGDWLPVERNVIHDCLRCDDTIYCYSPGEGFTSYSKRGESGFFNLTGTVESVPIHAYPISIVTIDKNQVWTMKRFRRQTQPEPGKPAPGRVLFDNLNRQGHIKGASDGSLLRDDGIMTAGWLIANNEDEKTAAIFAVTNISSLSSYRAELEGTFRLLKHIDYLGMSPDEVTHWCNNEAAVNATNMQSIHTPGDMLSPDMDIILAILHHKQRMSYTIQCKHVLAHQDTKKRKSKEEKDREKKLKAKERRARIREVDVGDGTHTPSPESSPSHSTTSDNSNGLDSTISSPRQELASTGLSDEAQMNVA